MQLPRIETRLVGKHSEEKMPFPLVRNVIGEPRCPKCCKWSPKDALFWYAAHLQVHKQEMRVLGATKQDGDLTHHDDCSGYADKRFG